MFTFTPPALEIRRSTPMRLSVLSTSGTFATRLPFRPAIISCNLESISVTLFLQSIRLL